MGKLREKERSNVVSIIEAFEKPLSFPISTTLIAVNDSGHPGRGAGREALRLNLIRPDHSDSQWNSTGLKRGKGLYKLLHEHAEESLEEGKRGVSSWLKPIVEVVK